MPIPLNGRRFMAASPVPRHLSRPRGWRLQSRRPRRRRSALPVLEKVSDCQTPMYAAFELLRAEGFTDVKFVLKGTGPDSSDWIGHDEIDFDWNFPPPLLE